MVNSPLTLTCFDDLAIPGIEWADLAGSNARVADLRLETGSEFQPAIETRQVKGGQGGFGAPLLPGVNIIDR